MLKCRWLLFALAAQCCGWLFLWVWLPCWDLEWEQGWLSRDRSAYYVDLTNYHKHPITQTYGRFDANAQRWNRVSRRYAFTEYPDLPSTSSLWQFEKRDDRTYVAEQFDCRSLATLQRREFQLPEDSTWKHSHVFMHLNRCFCSAFPDRIDYWDLTDPRSQMQSLPLEFSMATDNFFVLASEHGSLILTAFPHAAPQPMSFIALRLTPEGRYETAHSWITSRPQMTQVWQDKIVILDDGKKLFEVRSAGTGELLSSVSLPPNLNVSTMPFALEHHDAGPVLSYATVQGTQYFDVLRERVLNVPNGWELVCRSMLDGRLRILKSRSSSAIWDSESEQTLCDIPFVMGKEDRTLQILDRNTALRLSGVNGLTLDTIDIRTGRITQSYQPFRWAVGLLIALMLAYPFWCLACVQTSASLRWHPLADLFFIWGMPAVLAALFASSGGRPRLIWGYVRLPLSQDVLLGIATAMCGLAIAWAILSTQRWPWRWLPWCLWELVTALGVILATRATTHDPLMMLWYLHAPLPLFLVGLQIVRMTTRRLRSSLHTKGQMDRTRTGIADLFALTAIVALAVVSSGYARESYGALGLWAWNLAGGLALLIVVCCALSRHLVYAGFVGCVLCGCLLCLLTDAVCRWSLGIQLESYLGNFLYTRIVIVALVGLSAACLALRQHGFCLMRGKPKGNNLAPSEPASEWLGDAS